MVTGTALSLVRLVRFDMPDLRPIAQVSGALALAAAARAELRARFGVAVLDLYRLMETGPFAVRADGRAHAVATPDLMGRGHR